MAVYLAGGFDVHDAAEYARYRAAVAAIREGREGVALITNDDHPVMIEGTQPAKHLVIVKYPSIEAFRRYYESPAYQAASRHRMAAAETRYLMLMREPLPPGPER
jgi:uncharacterized protein (DUF1330 family)